VLDLGGTFQTQNGGLTLTGGTVQDGTLSSSGTFDLQAGTISAALAGTGVLAKTTNGTVSETSFPARLVLVTEDWFFARG